MEHSVKKTMRNASPFLVNSENEKFWYAFGTDFKHREPSTMLVKAVLR